MADIPGGVTPSSQSFKDSGQIRPGERLVGEMISREGETAVIRLKGAQYPVKFAGEMPKSQSFKVEILKTAPQVEVRLLPEVGAKAEGGLIRLSGGNLPAGTTVSVAVIKGADGTLILRIGGRDFWGTLPPEFAKPGTFAAKVVSDNPLLLMPEKQGAAMQRSELLALAGKDIAAMAKEMAAMKLSAISAGELRQLIRNSGLFLENKLATDKSVAGDVKLSAGIQGNQTVWDGITRMQLASLLLDDGIFSFFELDEMEGDGIVHVRREEHGAALYMKMNFTRLGGTVLSIVPVNTQNYAATVRTERDISAMLAGVKIAGAAVRWQRLRKDDIDIFDIGNKIVSKVGRFDITV